MPCQAKYIPPQPPSKALPLIRVPDSLAWLFKTLFHAVLLGTLCLASDAHGYQVLVSLNTYQQKTVQNAMDRVGELKCDGAWIITQNCDFTDAQWKSILKKLGGIQITEDNPGNNKSHTDYVRIMGKDPDGSFCYNETGGEPGGTLLSNEQIDAQSASHGKKPIIVLTRSYGGNWRTQTDRCLPNPKVNGLCMEYVKEALLENINDPAGGIRAALARQKPVYLLLHAGDDGWRLAENRRIIENLNKWCPKEMKRKDVYLVYQDYHGDSEAWFGREGVRAAIRQACGMPNYCGTVRNQAETKSAGSDAPHP